MQAENLGNWRAEMSQSGSVSITLLADVWLLRASCGGLGNNVVHALTVKGR
jgi:hypothetical protein